MKKILLLVFLLLLSSCSTTKIDEKNYHIVSYGEILEKIENKETFVYYVGQESCAGCKEYYQNLAKFFKDNQSLEIYYVSYEDNFASGKPYYNEHLKLNKYTYDYLGADYYEMFNLDKNIFYTPTSFKIDQGNYASTIIGSISGNAITNFYQIEYNNIKITEIDYDTMNNNITNLNDSIFYIGQEGCSACEDLVYKLYHLQKQESEKEIGYFNIKNIINDEEKMHDLKQFIFNHTGNIDDLLNLKTPTLVKISDKQVEVHVGTMNVDDLNDFIN